MTLPAKPQKLRCAACGQSSPQRRLLSTHSFGSPDLDLRPAPDEGRLLGYFLDICPSCGFSGFPLNGPLPAGAREVMASPEWAALGPTSGLPMLATGYKRRELLLSRAGQLKQAVLMALRAVWVCDDEAPRLARVLRREAVNRAIEARDAGVPYVDAQGGTETLVAELLRRCRDWDGASEWAQQGLAVATDPVLRQVLAFEVKLITARDGKVHRISEAMEG